MNGPRLTLASLLGIVAVVALGLAGIRSATTIWTSAAATLCLGVLLGSVLGACLLRGKEQAFCLGFALFGIIYLLLVEWDWVGAQFGHDLTAGLTDLAEALVPSPAVATQASPTGFAPNVPFELLAARQIRVGNFVQISRMLLALIFGLAGGYVGLFLVRRPPGADNERASS
jgi:hypothetical protein